MKNLFNVTIADNNGFILTNNQANTVLAFSTLTELQDGVAGILSRFTSNARAEQADPNLESEAKTLDFPNGRPIPAPLPDTTTGEQSAPDATDGTKAAEADNGEAADPATTAGQ